MTYQEIHASSLVIDSHCDTPLRLMDGCDIVHASKEGHFDLERMRAGGVTAAFFAVYTSNALSPDQATARAFNMISRINDFIAQNADQVALGRYPKDLYELRKEGKLGIFLGMENGAPIQKDLSLLRLFYKLGIRYLTLTHADTNEICDSCTSKNPRWNGLSPFGVEVVKEVNRLGMMVDVSHISDAAFYDVLKHSKAPVVATHSCCRSICNIPRNMSDQMIKDLAAHNGVIQINFYPYFIDEKYREISTPLFTKFDEVETLWKQDKVKYAGLYKEVKEELLALKAPSYKRVVDHVEHVVSLVGNTHVGLGSDFDGIETTPDGLSDISHMKVITKELLKRNFSERSIRNILGGNFARAFSQCMQIAYKQD